MRAPPSLNHAGGDNAAPLQRALFSLRALYNRSTPAHQANSTLVIVPTAQPTSDKPAPSGRLSSLTCCVVAALTAVTCCVLGAFAYASAHTAAGSVTHVQFLKPNCNVWEQFQQHYHAFGCIKPRFRVDVLASPPLTALEDSAHVRRDALFDELLDTGSAYCFHVRSSDAVGLKNGMMKQLLIYQDGDTGAASAVPLRRRLPRVSTRDWPNVPHVACCVDSLLALASAL